MKPELLKVLAKPNHSFSVRQDVVPYFHNRWHFHPEVELIHIQKGSGTQFMGDNISRFKKDDLILVGADLPHFWRCDELYFQKDMKVKAVATVSHFTENFWGQQFLDLPENTKIKALLSGAKRGISILGQTKQSVIQLLEDMLKADETVRIILLLKALHHIASSKNYRFISSSTFQQSPENKETERINSIYKYSLENFKTKITLQKIAAEASISPKSFCRYFKTHTRKTYNTFLQELRIGHATKLLIENKEPITQICYKSGFNNVTNFYKSFKKITGKTPLEYQNYFISKD